MVRSSRRTQHLTIYAGRHLGWWVEGVVPSGRRFMWTWWPTRRLARLVARTWAWVVHRAGGAAVTVTERAARA